MKLSFDWLSDFVDLTGVSPEELAEKLTMGAFEVEEVIKVGPDIQGPVVIGEIMEINQHPNADKIRVTKTRVAENAEPLEIVCGASNIEVGQRVPVALDGAKVINRKDGTALAIKQSAIRGVTSNGMLCSQPELGLVPPGTDTPEASGILILDKSHGALGTDVKELFDLKPDYVLVVGSRSNRGDALSVIGLAREVSALLQRPLKKLDWELTEKETKEISFVVNTGNTTDCPLFTTRVVQGVKIGPSPKKIARRLEAVGVRSINNVVDVTNYVMHEYGQPLHAYDLAKLSTADLTARRAVQGESITTLDGKERQLTEEVLIITNGAKAVGVAGVMGGENSEISDDTVALALEAACFLPARVRRGSRLLGLSSDASLRFERGVDVASVEQASNRATYLLLKHCSDGNSQISQLYCAGSAETPVVKVTLRLAQLKRFLGVEFTADQVKSLLTPLGFKVSEGFVDSVKTAMTSSVEFEIPSFRQSDVTREIDLVEEVCRIWGYDNLPVSMPRSSVAATPPDRTIDRSRAALVAAGLSEAWLSSLTAADTEANAQYSTQDESKSIKVLNPLSDDHQVLRQSLLPGLVKATVYNQDRGRKGVWLFEIGRNYTRCEGEGPHGTGVIENRHIAGVLMGDRKLSEWQETKNSAPTDFYTAKGVVENLLSTLGFDLQKIRFSKLDETKMLHPARSCQIAFDKAGGAFRKDKPENNGQEKSKNQAEVIGVIGQLHPGLADNVGLKQPAYLFELDLEVLMRLQKASTFKEIPTTPAILRDLTVDVKAVTDHAAVASCIKAAAGSTLKDVELVSIYQPDDNQRSLSYRLTFQDMQKTLTAEEVETTITKVRKKLTDAVGGSFRA